MSGYALRISAACDSGPGQVQWMYPLPDSPNMLAKFERDYPRHGEFLLAPVVERDDDQLWFNIEAGIIKRELHLRDASEIGKDDPDAIVFELRSGFLLVPDEPPSHEAGDPS